MSLNFRRALLTGALCVMFAAAPARAAVTSWVGGTNDWFQIPLWTNGVPGAGDTADVDSGTPTIGGGNAAADIVNVGNVAGQSANVLQTGGTGALDTINLGTVANATGTYSLQGTVAGASLTSMQQNVGVAGTGTFNQSINTSNTVNAVVLGDDGATGTYNFGGGTLSAADVIVGTGAGAGGTGIFNQSAGSTLTTVDLTLGNGFGTGTFNQMGGDTTVTGTTNIGLDDGTYKQTGGTFKASNDVNIAVNQTATGEYSITGGSFQAAGGVYVGGSANAVGAGDGTLIVDAAAAAFSVSSLNVSSKGFVQLTGPGGAAGPTLTLDTVTIKDSGKMEGSGTIVPLAQNGSVTFTSDGTVYPGQSELPGRLTINGSYTQEMNGAASFQLGGLTAVTEFDVLKVTGNADLDGMLAVSLINGFSPASGNTFKIITADGGVTDRFATADLPVLAPGLSWQVIYNPNDVTLKVVPEPASGLMLMFGAASATGIARARRRAIG